MKKHISVFLALALSIFLFSCQKGDTGPAGATGITPSDGLLVKTYQQGIDSYLSCYDVRIWSHNPDTAYGTDTTSWVGVEGPNTSLKRLIIEFYIYDLPDDAQIEKTVISLKTESVVIGEPSFTFYEMGTFWREDETTWNEARAGVSWTTPGGYFDGSTPVSNSVSVDSTYTWYSWTVDKDLIQSKINNGSSTYGFILVEDHESTPSTTNQVSFINKEYTTIEDRPKITIYYTLP